jgi:hypothetical protein
MAKKIERKSKLTKITSEDLYKKTKNDGTTDERSNRANTTDYVGLTFECNYDTFLVIAEADRVLSKNGKHLYRNFHVRCVACGTERETLIASLIGKGVACRECQTTVRGVRLDLSKPPITLEGKIEAMHEINQIWDQMKRLARAGQLTKYLVEKFDVNKYLIEEDNNEEEDNNPIDNYDDIDYTDDTIDWDNELDKYL